MKNFTYQKPNGEISERSVFVITPASDLMLTIDLSEFDDEERIWYNDQLVAAYDKFKDEIKSLGLGHNYRNFKKERIIDGMG